MRIAAAIAIAVALAGCSKSEDGTETVKNMDPIVTKEQITGVWRSGEYWISFSADGYNSAYFPIENDERIDEGTYAIEGDTVTVASQLYYSWTKYIIKSISESSMAVEIVYSFYGYTRFADDEYEVKKTLTLTKSNDTPCKKDDGLDKKSFDMLIPLLSSPAEYATQTNTFHAENHYIKYTMEYKEDAPWSDISEMGSKGTKYYVYMPPLFLSVVLSDESGYERNTKVEKGLLTEDEGGNLTYKPKE